MLTNILVTTLVNAAAYAMLAGDFADIRRAGLSTYPYRLHAYRFFHFALIV